LASQFIHKSEVLQSGGLSPIPINVLWAGPPDCSLRHGTKTAQSRALGYSSKGYFGAIDRRVMAINGSLWPRKSI